MWGRGSLTGWADCCVPLAPLHPSSRIRRAMRVNTGKFSARCRAWSDVALRSSASGSRPTFEQYAARYSFSDGIPNASRSA